MRKTLILLILLIFCISATPPKQAIILAGQSNMNLSAENITAMMPDYLVVNCAVNGTSITMWQKGEVLYEDCIAKVKIIQDEGYIVKGIFFYQGENNTFTADISRQWKRLFYRFVNHFRADIGVNAPVIFAQLGHKPLQVRPYWNVVKNQQRLSESVNKEIYIITTGDIRPYCPVDAVHFCPEGYKIIAGRFVDKFEEQR